MEEKNNSILPLIFGIVGACAAAYFTVTGIDAAGTAGMILGWVAVAVGLIFAFFAKTNAVLCTVAEFISAVLILVLFFMTSFTNWFGWIALILFALAGIFASTQKSEENTVN